jgi:hypothetical protein
MEGTHHFDGISHMDENLAMFKITFMYESEPTHAIEFQPDHQ